MIQRIREFPDDLAAMYPSPHNHKLYGLGHHLRVEMTIVLAAEVMRARGWQSVADLSCGNAEIARRLTSDPTLGDFAAGYPLTGPLETTLPTIARHDIYVCSETIEHLDNPSLALLLMREKAHGLVLSTPLECWDDGCAEHLWAWDRNGVEGLMAEAGWTSVAHAQLDARVFGETYLYGIWVAN